MLKNTPHTTKRKAAEAAAQAVFNVLDKKPGAARTAAPGLDSDTRRLVIKNQAQGPTLLRGTSAISSEYQPWGPDNRYPDLMLEAIAGSGTGSVCTHTKAKFIKADGFADLDFYRAVINRQGLKVDSLLGLHAPDLSNLYGVAVLLNFNAFGHQCEVIHAPIAQWRPAVADKDGVVRGAYILSNTKALLRTNSLAKTKAVRYNLYNTQELPADRIARIEALDGGLAAYAGEVHIYFHRTTGAINHPRPLHDSVIRDMISEAALKVSKGTDIRNAFSAQTMITEYGTASPTKEKLEADNAKYSEVVGEDGVRLIVQYAQDKDSKPDVDSFQVNNASERYKTDGETIKNDIRNVFLIPTILYGEAIAGKLGGQQDIEDACQYVQKFVVNEDLRALELFYAEIFTNFWPMGATAPGINPSQDYTIQPLSMLPQEAETAEPTQEDKVLAKLQQVDALVANELLKVLTVQQKLRLLGYDVPDLPAPAAAAPTPTPTPVTPAPNANPAA